MAMENKIPARPIPASPSIVKEFISRLLQSGEPMKRDEIVARVRIMAPKDEFILDAGAVPTVKKALQLLAEERTIESPRVGWWRIVQSAGVASPLAESTEEIDSDEETTEQERSPRVRIQREMGIGPESVYVYYHDAYAELAQQKGLSEWECKIGSTLGDPDVRVMGQGALTAFPRCPVIGLVIRTDNARVLERALHMALTLAGKRIEDGGGSEWFKTSPDRVEHWVQGFCNSLTDL